MNTRTRQHGGYTLVEMMVTLIILGVAAALLVPTLGGFGSIETQSAVRRLVSDIAFAQSEAVAHQEFHRVVFHDDGSGWSLVRVEQATFFDPFAPGTAEYLTDPARVNRGGGDFIVDLAADSRFQSVAVESVATAEGVRIVTFDPLGGTVAAPGTAAGAATVVLSGDDSRWEVAVAPVTGRTSVRKLN
ncbi:MAG: GspH/FimT family pseudopilin [Phycisphaerales bacterium]|nr:GspH/FimT family pseudopilin [Phycisphaerales bacterium]